MPHGTNGRVRAYEPRSGRGWAHQSRNWPREGCTGCTGRSGQVRGLETVKVAHSNPPHVLPRHHLSCPPAASARSGQPRISPCRWIPCPGPPDPGAASLHRPAGPAAQHYASKTSRQAGQRWTDRAAGRRSAERHFVVVFYYYHGSDPCRARGIRAREGVSRCPARRRG